MSSITIYTDGGARGNPGPSGIGAVVYDASHMILQEIHAFLGVQTNNYAEYEAVIRALTWCIQNKYHTETIEIRADSKLIVEQLCGNWKVKDPHLKVQYAKARELITVCKEVSFTYIPREDNTVADALANRAMDEGFN